MSLTMFKELAATQAGNVLFSPACFEEALLYVGKYTAGQTREELKGLRFSAKDTNTAMTPKAASALFVANDMELCPIKENVMRVPFTTAPTEAVQFINDWLTNVTQGVMPGVIRVDDVGKDTRMLVVSALTLHEGWVETFNKSDNIPDHPFTLSDGSVVKVTMMSAKDSTSHRYAEGEDWQAVRLMVMPRGHDENKYAGSFIAIRPRGDVREFAAKLTPELLAHIYKELSRRTVYVEGEKWYIRYTDVKLPRFSLHPERVDLAPFLQKHGVCSLFAPGADFSHLTKESGMYLRGLIQKNGLDVHENGFCAASVTWGDALGEYDCPEEQHFSITFDKPFIFIIGTMHPKIRPFFMGICENPVAQENPTVYVENAGCRGDELLEKSLHEPVMRLLLKSPWGALFDGTPSHPCFSKQHACKLKAGVNAEMLLKTMSYEAKNGEELKVAPISCTTVKENGKVYVVIRADVDFAINDEACCGWDIAFGGYYADFWFEITEEIEE